MHVAICIVSFRNVADVTRCLASLVNSNYRDFSVIICENGGTHAYEILSESLKTEGLINIDLTIINADANLGYAGGVNSCIQRSPAADAWWILNPDTVPARETLNLLVDELRSGRADAVGCTIVFPDGRVQSRGGHWSAPLARSHSIGIGDLASTPVKKFTIERRQNYLNGASMLVSRKFINSAGLMRTDYFLYCEEVEWCLRAQRKGLRLAYANGGDVIHFQGTTTGAGGPAAQRSKLSIYLGERNKILVTRDLFPILLPIATFATLVQLCVRYGRALALQQLFCGLHGWFNGIRNERGCPSWLAP